MAFPTPVIRWVLARTVSHGLTGRPSDLTRLIRLSKRVPMIVSIRGYLAALEEALDNGKPMGELFLRMGRQLSPRCSRMVVSNLIYNEFISGYRTRRARSNDGNWVPGFFVMSPTMQCTLSCRGCYSGLYDREQVLPFQEMDRLLTEARRLGIYFTVISGGEPYLLADTLLRLFRRHDRMYFLTYTNGTLLDPPLCRELARLGNVAVAISVEGFREETDDRRGPGVFDRVMEAMKALREEGVLFGFSATATSRNLDAITSDDFIRLSIAQGALFGWYFLFLPVGSDPVLELVPTAEQRVELGRRVSRLRTCHPIFLGDFWNDGPAVGGCMAGGRNYLHILNNGNVEPCVFCHFSSDNIKGKTLLEVTNSPFFKAIRAEFPYNQTGNLLRPCMIIDNPEVLRKLVREYAIPTGHRDADAIISDPRVTAWADRYSKEMETLTEPLWEQVVNDPCSRWFREGAEYRNHLRPAILFQGQRPASDFSQPISPAR